MNITGVNGGPLLVDNEEYLYRIIRKRNIVKGEAVDGEQADADAGAGVGDILDMLFAHEDLQGKDFEDIDEESMSISIVPVNAYITTRGGDAK